MRRREFIWLAGGASLAWAITARAENRPRRIGILLTNSEGAPGSVRGLAIFRQTLQRLGWSEGRDVQIDVRWGQTDPNQIAVGARDLVELRPDAICVTATPGVAALKRETQTIPIVFVAVSDPVGSGFVESLARPGGNITGFIDVEGSLGGKWIEILKDIAPNTKHAAILFNPKTAPFFSYFVAPFEAAARLVGIEPRSAPVDSAEEIKRVMMESNQTPNSGLALVPDAFLTDKSQLDLIISLAAELRLPAIYPYRHMVAAGGLVSYGIDVTDLYRRASEYIDRILKGAKPEELPVQVPTKFETLVNLKTAKTLGLTIPPTLLSRADEVIE
jgi:putative ABC transport system substrate-binding protein